MNKFVTIRVIEFVDEVKKKMDAKQKSHFKKCKECQNDTWNIYADAFGDVEKILNKLLKN